MKSIFQVVLLVIIMLNLIKAQTTIQVGNTTLTERDVVTGLDIPWDLEWGPDNHIWFTERAGKVKRVDPISGNTTTILDIRNTVINGGGEPGLLGMLFHPDWDNTPKVFLAYTYGSFSSVTQRLSTFEWDGTLLTNEEIVLDDIAGGSIHNGSRLALLGDNTILMTTGDKGDQNLPQNSNSINGKVLRMNLDGSIPDDNPFPNSLVYSLGHRNSQGIFVAANGIVYSSEFGPNSSDEINIIEAGRNYGWPNVLGICNTAFEIAFCNDNNVKEPIHEWSNTPSPNGLLVYNHPAIPEWENKLMVALLGGISLQQPRISVFDITEDGLGISNETRFFETFGRLRDLCINPQTGSVYFATNGPNYPGSSPNRIVEYYNADFVVDVKNEIDVDQFVKVYPNPATEKVNVEVSESFLGKQLEIISFSSGVSVRSFEIGKSVEIVDVNDLPSGQYYISIVNERGLITKVFVKE